jgi:cell division septation protein DedD
MDSRSNQRAATAPSLLPDILGRSQFLRCSATTTGRLVVRDLDRLQEKVVIELDNHQVALAILGLVVVSIGTFTAGVVAGQRMGGDLPLGLDPALSEAIVQAEGSANRRKRMAALTNLPLGTRRMDTDLAKAPVDAPSDDPTEAARIEARRQLAAARAGTIAGSEGHPQRVPTAIAGKKAASVAHATPQKPLTWISTDPAKERSSLEGSTTATKQYALEVSAFGSAAPAEMVASQLRSGGHAVNVRQLSDPRGQTIWRVEVGSFKNMSTASTFQRQFERTAGYSTVMIPIP